MSHNPQIDQATAMMVAADLMEQPGRFNYWEYKAEYCDTRGGCPGAWIAYVGGLKDANAAFEWLGFDSLSRDGPTTPPSPPPDCAVSRGRG